MALPLTCSSFDGTFWRSFTFSPPGHLMPTRHEQVASPKPSWEFHIDSIWSPWSHLRHLSRQLSLHARTWSLNRFGGRPAMGVRGACIFRLGGIPFANVPCILLAPDELSCLGASVSWMASIPPHEPPPKEEKGSLLPKVNVSPCCLKPWAGFAFVTYDTYKDVRGLSMSRSLSALGLPE